jgi:hypothetical protein
MLATVDVNGSELPHHATSGASWQVQLEALHAIRAGRGKVSGDATERTGGSHRYQASEP